MKISSEHINNLLAYARERHGAPCRIRLQQYLGKVYADFDVQEWVSAEEIEVTEE